MNVPRFQMRQCVRETCRFRFPVPAGSAVGESCPRCGALTAFATDPVGGREAPAGHALGAAPVEALLDNIRSSFNVGAIFRTADGAGLRHLHLAGITATPEHPRVAKTALGAESALSWHYYSNGLTAAGLLQQRGYRLWALENTATSASLFRARPVGEAPILLVVGNEKAGVDPGILALCDNVVHIPMAGKKSSLNVAIAFGIAAYYLTHGLPSGDVFR